MFTNYHLSPFSSLCSLTLIRDLCWSDRGEKEQFGLMWVHRVSPLLPKCQKLWFKWRKEGLGGEQVIRRKRERSGGNVCCVYFSPILVHWAWLTWGQIWTKMSLWQTGLGVRPGLPAGLWDTEALPHSASTGLGCVLDQRNLWSLVDPWNILRTK